ELGEVEAMLRGCPAVAEAVVVARAAAGGGNPAGGDGGARGGGARGAPPPGGGGGAVAPGGGARGVRRAGHPPPPPPRHSGPRPPAKSMGPPCLRLNSLARLPLRSWRRARRTRSRLPRSGPTSSGSIVSASRTTSSSSVDIRCSRRR